MTYQNQFSVGCLLTRPQQSKSHQISSPQTPFAYERHEMAVIERQKRIKDKVLKRQSVVQSISTQRQRDQQFYQFWLPCLSNKKPDGNSSKTVEKQVKLAQSKSQKFIPQASSEYSHQRATTERALSQKTLSTTLEDSHRFSRLHFVLKSKGKEDLQRQQKNVGKNSGQNCNNKMKISEQYYNFKKKRTNEIQKIPLTAPLCKMCQKSTTEKKKLQLQLTKVKQKLDLLKQHYDQSYQQIKESLKKMQTDLYAMVENLMKDTLCQYEWQRDNRKQTHVYSIFPPMKQEYTIKQSVDDLIEEVSQNILKGIQRQIQKIVNKQVSKNRKMHIGKIIKNGSLSSKTPIAKVQAHKLDMHQQQNGHQHSCNQQLSLLTRL